MMKLNLLYLLNGGEIGWSMLALMEFLLTFKI
jgi:hypothetical protein